jgi:hypothetical protein
VAANGGSDLIYIPSKNRQLISAILKALYEQDYVSGVFVDDVLGSYAGALPLSAINLRGQAITPRPSIVVNFRSFLACPRLPPDVGKAEEGERRAMVSDQPASAHP